MEMANSTPITTDAFENQIDATHACAMDDREVQYDSALPASATVASQARATNSTGLKYAPIMPTKKGTYDLYPISLSWTDAHGVSKSQLNNVGRDVASTYNRLSNGAIKFNVKPSNILITGVPKSASAVPAATAKAKAQFTDRNSPYIGFYAVINNGAKKVSQAGNRTASLLNPLLTTARHEVGHLLGLKHANRYAEITSGKHKGELEFQSSRDGSSFMSIYSSGNLTSAQMYAMGWYKENQVAMHETGDPEMLYDLQPVCNKANSNYLNAIFMPNQRGSTPVFLSLFENAKTGKNANGAKERLLALHVGDKGGSTRLNVFKGHGETDNLAIDLVEEAADYWRVKVSSKGGASK